MTNPDSKQTIYSLNSNVRQSAAHASSGIASANCPESDSFFAYDGNNFVNQFTDGEGRVTSYVREARGLPTSITRGTGTTSAATATVTWRSTWHVPTQVVEPSRTTNYVWSSAGQLTLYNANGHDQPNCTLFNQWPNAEVGLLYTGLHL